MNTLYFFLYMLALFVAPAIVVGLVLVAINAYRDNRTYLDFEEEVYEGRKAESDMPKEPYE
jgi:hypothetical protein